MSPPLLLRLCGFLEGKIRQKALRVSEVRPTSETGSDKVDEGRRVSAALARFSAFSTDRALLGVEMGVAAGTAVPGVLGGGFFVGEEGWE